jgi:3-deoxy-7-phosphoheptulonate synthase
MLCNTDDLRIQGLANLTSPNDLIHRIPVKESAAILITKARETAARIMAGQDDRLLVVVGPCSIHDPEAALEYATKLKAVANALQQDLLIIMRVYFEKPRTTVGWKGLINDPHLNNSFDINQGLQVARKLLSDITDIGLPIATEFLDTISPQFISDFIAWGAIGARTTESQVHRELASGLSMPIGFKNGTSGNVRIAIDAIQAASHSHHFLSVTKNASAAIVRTLGNKDCHVILRGSSQGTNYDEQSILAVAEELKAANLPTQVMIDCSHGNSRKDYRRQPLVAKALAAQIAAGSEHVAGVMIESHLQAGRQDLLPGKPLVYGQSITDACISFSETIEVLEGLAMAVRERRRLKLSKQAPDDELLADLRAQIDEIDMQIQSLLQLRASTASEIGKMKRHHNQQAAVYRPERETQILAQIKARNAGKLPDEALESVYRQIMTLCRSVQSTGEK